ncbi:MAG: hypothetical protein CUN50_01980 [Candidatus Thermofonsia Clade 1 bacterium]|uniref:Uncharacterized protein n=1 Tax=Candidatus Thermofonsia Clade 1 bacterium TaxID=2364210 RepID=A0A2M8PZS3_9CHLR|nr:MAG: hypothetical protein CUN50_01980 [Candidatus Thermofonsia Clade 1 bacterium]
MIALDCNTLLAASARLALLEDCTLGAPMWIVVSDEVGMGIVQLYRLGKLYRVRLVAPISAWLQQLMEST